MKKVQDEENIALASKGKKKSNKEQMKASSSKSGKKKDLSKIKKNCCHQLGHYASQCLNKKNKDKQKKQVVATTEVDDFASQFENEFSLIVYLSSSIAKRVRHIDSGASCHMMGVKEFVSPIWRRRSWISILS